MGAVEGGWTQWSFPTLMRLDSVTGCYQPSTVLAAPRTRGTVPHKDTQRTELQNN